MINAIKGLFSAKKIAETGASMLDNAFFTDQEKSKLMLEYIKATMPMARTRRIIACMVAFVWLVCVMAAGFLLLSESPHYQEWQKFMSEHINTPFGVVMGFYYLAHVVSRGKA